MRAQQRRVIHDPVLRFDAKLASGLPMCPQEDEDFDFAAQIQEAERIESSTECHGRWPQGQILIESVCICPTCLVLRSLRRSSRDFPDERLIILRFDAASRR